MDLVEHEFAQKERATSVLTDSSVKILVNRGRTPSESRRA